VDGDSRRRRCGFERINSDHLQGTMVWVQEDTERDYSQTEYGKNVLVVGNRGDDENPQGDADSRRRCANIEGWI
jgi:hypothetical protein